MCHSTVAEGFSLIYSASLYSGSGFLSGMQCVTIQWPLVSLRNAICHSTVYLELSLVAFSHSTAAVGYSLVCNGSLISGRGFLSGMLFVSIQWPWFSIWYAMCHSTVAMGSFCYSMCHSKVAVGFYLVCNVLLSMAVGFTLVCNVALYIGSGFNSAMQCVYLVAVGFSASLYSASEFLSVMQCVTLLWPWVSVRYAICFPTKQWVSLSHSNEAVGFLSAMQCITLHKPWVSLCYAICHFTAAMDFSLICKVSLHSGSGFLSGMQCVTLQRQ